MLLERGKAELFPDLKLYLWKI